MQESIKLPFQFDAEKMLSELQSISSSFSLIKNAYTGNFLSGAHLIYQKGDGSFNEKGESFYMAPELQDCPYLQEVLNTFKSNKFTFRAQNLLPGGKIGRHSDLDKGLEHGIIRLNLPVSTNEDIHTYYDDKLLPMKNGECWLPNVIKPHEMINNSKETRWMLLMDCDLNEWWKEVLTDCGLDFTNESKHKYQSLEALEDMKSNFLSLGFKEDHELIKEIELELSSRV